MKNEALNIRAVEDKIISLRNEKVILDTDVATLYNVETREVNQAIKNNPDKFPAGYVFEVTKTEMAALRSKILTLKTGGGRGQHAKYMPKAFTERGLYMLATILKSPQATQTTITIVDTFTKLRELGRTVSELVNTQEKEAQKLLMQKSSDLFADVIGKELQVSNTETSFELNLALVKFKHTVTQSKELEEMKKLLNEQSALIKKLTNK